MTGGILTIPTAAFRASAYYNVSETLGCGGEAAGVATRVCLTTKTATDITDILNSANAGGLGFFAFGPTIDEELEFSDYFARATAGEYVKNVCSIPIHG
jgi:cholinesterase